MALESGHGEAIAPSGNPFRPTGLPVGPAIPPLNVSALVVSGADLVAALRLYVPQLRDVTPLDDGRFLLSLAPSTPGDDGGA